MFILYLQDKQFLVISAAKKKKIMQNSLNLVFVVQGWSSFTTGAAQFAAVASQQVSKLLFNMKINNIIIII